MKNNLAILLTIVTLFSCSTDNSEPETPKNDAKEIFSFAFRASDNDQLSNDIFAKIDQNTKTITANINNEAAMKSLIPEIGISDNASISPNQTVAQDFSKPIQYIVEAEDNTKVIYTVNLILISDANQMLSFVFKAADNNNLTNDVIGVINHDTKEVKAILPSGIESRSLIPTIQFSDRASVQPKSGEQQDFTKQLTYSVVAENGFRNNYKVNISVKISDKERNALKAIHLANPTNTLNWDFTEDTNVSWEGVGIVNGEVKSLSIPIDHNITTIPTEIGDLVNLNSLRINSNRQIGSFPESIKNLINIEELDLKLTGLKGFPIGIPYMTKLRKLNLSNNTIISLPSNIGNLKNLEEFRASYSSLNNFPVELTTLTNLKILDLFSNSGIATIPTEIGNLVKLSILNLHGGSITDIPSTIGNLTNLDYLDIAVNKLTSVPSELGNLVNLTKLFMRTNQLTSLPVEIGNLTKLKELEIWGNVFTSIPQKVCDLKNTGTKITKDDNVTCN
ncbi:MAG: leucine-rich repeat domain-containing protein [Gelidibacter sp.]